MVKIPAKSGVFNIEQFTKRRKTIIPAGSGTHLKLVNRKWTCFLETIYESSNGIQC
jgi:hypothetical protein